MQEDEQRRLLERAKEELLEDAARGLGPSRYNVACICAELGEIDEYRQRLIESREPGGFVSRDQMLPSVNSRVCGSASGFGS